MANSVDPDETAPIGGHFTFFSPVQKIKIVLTKFLCYDKIQGFVETLQIISFQNDK